MYMYMSQEVGRPFSEVNTSQLAASRDDSDIYYIIKEIYEEVWQAIVYSIRSS